MQFGDMDVSGGADDPRSFPAFSDGKEPTAAAAAEAAGAELGYQGWAARRLVLACHRIFVEREGNTDLVSESLQHRGMIYWCLSNINSEAAAGLDAPASEADLRDEDVFHDGLTDFYHVWTLAEAFLLDSAPLPAAPLLRWLKMYSQSSEDEAVRFELDEAERVARAADDAGGSADPDAGYWNAVRSLVVGVSPRRAAEMLRCHPEGRDNAGEVGALARQLEKMPLLLPERADGEDAGAEAHLDREGFFETWTRWRKSCNAAAENFGGSGGDGGEERRQLRLLWGTLCGKRECLVEATQSWSGLFAAVLAFERPNTRKEEVAAVMRECTRKHAEHQHEGFLIRVIRDASAGAVDSVLKFAREHGETLALSACATHLVDLLSRSDLTSVTNQQRSWFFRRLADRLRALPCGGWELAAAYLSGGGGDDDNESGGDDDETELLRKLARGVVPGSERATHELVGWCRANGLGEEAAAAVCRARGAAWLEKTGFSPAAMGTMAEEEDGDGGASSRVSGACGKAAYWLAKGGGGVQLERLCAEVSERLMVEVSPRAAGSAADVEAQQAVLAEAEGVLAAIPPGVSGPELSFLERYKDIADLLSADAARPSPHQQGLGSVRGSPLSDSAGPGARLAGAIAVDMLAPRDGGGGEGGDAEGDLAEGGVATSCAPEPPSRSWAHLLRLSVPALKATSMAAAGEADEEQATVTAAQVHALLAKLQLLVASERRVGSVRGAWAGLSGGGGSRGSKSSTLDSAPAPYGFRRGDAGGDELLEVRRALANCLAATMMVQNEEEAAPEAVRRRGGRTDLLLLGAKRLPAEALVAPRVAV